MKRKTYKELSNKRGGYIEEIKNIRFHFFWEMKKLMESKDKRTLNYVVEFP